MLVRGLVDVLELRVTVRMRGAFLPFARAIAAGSPGGAAAGPQWSNSPATPARSAPPPASRDSCTSSAAARSGRPRVSGSTSALERGLDAGLILLDAGPSAARASDAVRRRLVAGNLPASLANRLPSQTGGRRNHRVAAVADGERLGRRPPAATALVQHGLDGGILRNKGRFQLDVSLHASSMTRKPTGGKLV